MQVFQDAGSNSLKHSCIYHIFVGFYLQITSPRKDEQQDITNRVKQQLPTKINLGDVSTTSWQIILISK